MMKNLMSALLLTLSLTSMSALAEPATKESIKALMNKTGAGEMGMLMMNQLLPTLKQMIPEAPEKFWADVMTEMKVDEINELVIPVYQKYLNAKDIKELNAFYDTPAGKKLIRVQPKIMQESMVIGQAWGQQTAINVINKYKQQAENQP